MARRPPPTPASRTLPKKAAAASKPVKKPVKKTVKKTVKKPVKKIVKKTASPKAPQAARQPAAKLRSAPVLGRIKPAAPVANSKPAAPQAASRSLAQKKPVATRVPPVKQAGSPPQAVQAHLIRPGEPKTDWFARVAHDYDRFLYATALSITRNNNDAEDAVQSGIMNGLNRLDQLTDGAAVVSWLAMITRNAALDLLRRRKRTPGGGGDSTVLPLVAPDQSGSEFQLSDDLREVLARAITTLPPSYQEVVNARHFRGLEIEDIAKDLRVTENSIRVRLFRAYEKLRESAQIRRALGLPPEKKD